MFNLGFSELLLLGLIALIFIGPNQLPEVARTIGRLLNEWKRATSDIQQTLTTHITEDIQFRRLDGAEPSPEKTYAEHIGSPDGQLHDQIHEQGHDHVHDPAGDHVHDQHGDHLHDQNHDQNHAQIQTGAESIVGTESSGVSESIVRTQSIAVTESVAAAQSVAKTQTISVTETAASESDPVVLPKGNKSDES